MWLRRVYLFGEVRRWWVRYPRALRQHQKVPRVLTTLIFLLHHLSHAFWPHNHKEATVLPSHCSFQAGHGQVEETGTHLPQQVSPPWRLLLLLHGQNHVTWTPLEAQEAETVSEHLACEQSLSGWKNRGMRIRWTPDVRLQ